ncbi:unnamed protein product [Pleuronectes platessa]|uniref:Uncharacterized protein n=1 Tax=Pleuronectes platessa TaxID=8262 RepID=A0A9N7VET0_PLEPL|nr:unnamed protein product [Pleuronectes platessa]
MDWCSLVPVTDLAIRLCCGGARPVCSLTPHLESDMLIQGTELVFVCWTEGNRGNRAQGTVSDSTDEVSQSLKQNLIKGAVLQTSDQCPAAGRQGVHAHLTLKRTRDETETTLDSESGYWTETSHTKPK